MEGAKPLLQWVLEGVQEGWPDAPIWVSIHDPAVIADVPGVAELTDAGRLRISVSRDGGDLAPVQGEGPRLLADRRGLCGRCRQQADLQIAEMLLAKRKPG